jgi:hypothetical protein
MTPIRRTSAGLILATSDGGAHWRAPSAVTSAYQFSAMSFAESRHGCVVGDANTGPSSGALFMTSDGTTRWKGGPPWKGRLGAAGPGLPRSPARRACPAGEAGEGSSAAIRTDGGGGARDEGEL